MSTPFEFPYNVQKDTPAVAVEVQSNFDALRMFLLANYPQIPDIEANIQQAMRAATPAGTVRDFMGTVIPSGHLAMMGQVVANAETLYPAWWDVLPASMKDGSNALMPETRRRVTVGYDATEPPFDAIGKTGGFRNATLVQHNHGTTGTPSNNTSGAPSVASTSGQSDNHTHSISFNTGNQINANSWTHNIGTSVESFGVVRFSSKSGFIQLGTGTSGWYLGAIANTNTQSSGHQHQISGSTSTVSQGHTHSMQAHNHSLQNHTHSTSDAGISGVDRNLPPFITFMKIVRVY